MKRKVKKFGRGGDILTALGAGLAGYGVYKALNKDKDEVKERKDYLKDAIERAPKTDSKDEAAKVVKPPPGVIFEEDRARDRALKQSKGQGNLVPEGSTEQDRNTLYESDKALVRTDDKKAVNKNANKPYKPKIPPKASVVQDTQKRRELNAYRGAGQSQDAPKSEDKKDVTTSLKEKNAVTLPYKTDTAPKPQPLPNKAGEAPKPTLVAEKKYGIGPHGAFGDVEKALSGPSKAKTDQDAYRKTQAEKEAREAKAKKDRMAQYAKDHPVGKKAGGSVKKMASGGMARSSASKRADGCAIRGKTRA